LVNSSYSKFLVGSHSGATLYSTTNITPQARFLLRFAEPVLPMRVPISAGSFLLRIAALVETSR
jgi:hypothetical protein